MIRLFLNVLSKLAFQRVIIRKTINISNKFRDLSYYVKVLLSVALKMIGIQLSFRPHPIEWVLEQTLPLDFNIYSFYNPSHVKN